MKLSKVTLTALLGLFLALPARAETTPSELWSALASGGHAALMRHAEAPGTGDPANFRIGDCATQRNLDEGGREQARRTGERFREAGIDQARVYSSQWCRCLDTAELLDLGAVEPLPALNSFFQNRSQGPAQTEDLKTFLAGAEPGAPLVLVTHQVNITALTDIFPRSGEIVVLRLTGGEPEVAGRILPQ